MTSFLGMPDYGANGLCLLRQILSSLESDTFLCLQSTLSSHCSSRDGVRAGCCWGPGTACLPNPSYAPATLPDSQLENVTSDLLPLPRDPSFWGRAEVERCSRTAVPDHPETGTQTAECSRPCAAPGPTALKTVLRVQRGALSSAIAHSCWTAPGDRERTDGVNTRRPKLQWIQVLPKFTKLRLQPHVWTFVSSPPRGQQVNAGMEAGHRVWFLPLPHPSKLLKLLEIQAPCTDSWKQWHVGLTELLQD